MGYLCLLELDRNVLLVDYSCSDLHLGSRLSGSVGRKDPEGNEGEAAHHYVAGFDLYKWWDLGRMVKRKWAMVNAMYLGSAAQRRAMDEEVNGQQLLELGRRNKVGIDCCQDFVHGSWVTLDLKVQLKVKRTSRQVKFGGLSGCPEILQV
jgi:hypothetical protein